LQDSAVAENLHDVLVGKVEKNLEVGFVGAGKSDVDEERGVGIESLDGRVIAQKGEAPGCLDEDVAGIERYFVDGGELRRLRTEPVEKGFAFGEGIGEVAGTNGLRSGRACEEKRIGKVRDHCGHIVVAGFAGVEGEEA